MGHEKNTQRQFSVPIIRSTTWEFKHNTINWVSNSTSSMKTLQINGKVLGSEATGEVLGDVEILVETLDEVSVGEDLVVAVVGCEFLGVSSSRQTRGVAGSVISGEGGEVSIFLRVKN